MLLAAINQKLAVAAMVCSATIGVMLMVHPTLFGKLGGADTPASRKRNRLLGLLLVVIAMARLVVSRFSSNP